MAHIVIVAGGLGSRLAPLTNFIPKFLVNIGKHTGYVEQVKYWLSLDALCHREDDEELATYQEQLHSLTVIVHSAYKDLIEAYHKLYFPTVPLIVKTVDVHNGSAHAILSTCDHLEGQSVFFQWCDVMPGVQIPVHEMGEHYCGANVIFTNYDHPNRYGLVREGAGWADVVPAIQEDGRGGIFGLYYVSSFWPKSMTYENGQDFVEVIRQAGHIREHKLESIVDWGDKPKLERTRDTADAAREFNSVSFQGDLVLKAALNKQGETLIAREIEWYRSLKKLGSRVSVPDTWPADDKKSFIMSKVEGVPIFKLWPTLDDEGRELVLTRVFEQLDKLHGTSTLEVGVETVLRDVKLEACDKLLARYREIKDVIASFGPVHTVNGWQIGLNVDPEVTIQRLYAALHSHYAGTKEYNLIHGDLQMSNSMINPDTLEVTLIDPRGYFGKSDTYGLADYDIAKLYYSLSGYDLFNYSREFNIRSLKDGHIEFDIPQPNRAGCDSVMMKRFWSWHQLWLAVIWIGLAGYIKNDPVKSVAAHYHGLAMADKVLSECFSQIDLA
jgi:hypothetical protein